MGLSQSRRADLIMLLMLVISGVVSLGFSVGVVDYLEQHPASFLGHIIAAPGSIRGYPSHKGALWRGFFFLPFSTLGGISFLIYLKYLKGKLK